jgi:N-acyl-L-homoserine lactone synthetase
MRPTMTARYDLDPAAVQRITTEFLAAYPTGGRFVTAVVGPDSDLAAVGRTLERQVFEETFGNDATVMAAEYGPYEASSLFFVVIDRKRGVPAGVARMIESRGAGVKTVDDAPQHIGADVATILAAHGMTGEKVWDCATLAVLPQYRGRRSALLVSTMIYRTFLVMGRRHGVRHAVSMLDRGAYRNLKLIGVPMRTLADSGPFEYLGSAENRAVHMDFPAIEAAVREQAARMRRAARPGLAALRRDGVRKLLTKRVAAGVSLRIGTGKDVDGHIVVVPGEQGVFRLDPIG